MDLKEKTKEAKEYGEIKKELIELTEEFLAKYREYEDIYRNIFTSWVDKTVAEFEAIFKSEEFNVTSEVSRYPNMCENYKTVKAVLCDLEFELLITVDECQDILFLQTKPETEGKNIAIRPTLEKYHISKIYIKSNKEQDKYKENNFVISSIYDLERTKEKIVHAKFSVIEMKDLISEIEKETKLLLDELEKAKLTHVKSIAISNKGYKNKDSNSAYGEFEKLSELIERI